LTRRLIDLNVVLDVLLDRRPHVVAAARVWEAIETGRFQGVLPAHAFTTVHYLAARARGRAFARRTLLTRDPGGFPDPPLRVIDPETALAGLGLL
jgi:predicted nucleic acid-binding protein